jgi:hypothetical protein
VILFTCVIKREWDTEKYVNLFIQYLVNETKSRNHKIGKYFRENLIIKKLIAMRRNWKNSANKIMRIILQPLLQNKIYSISSTANKVTRMMINTTLYRSKRMGKMC